MLSPISFLIVCPLVFAAGLVDAIAGGGGLISLPAYLLAGLPPINAIATNKVSSSMGTTMATVRYARSGYVLWKLALCCILCSIAGSQVGARLALTISDGVFRILLLVVLPLTGAYVLFGKPLSGEKPPFGKKKTTLICMVGALFIGVYDGFYGPGTGTFLILILTGAARLPLQKANGVTKVLNLTTNLSAVAVYITSGKSVLALGLTAGLFSIAGNYIGTRFFDKGGAKFVRPFMLLVLTVFLVKVILELCGISL